MESHGLLLLPPCIVSSQKVDFPLGKSARSANPEMFELTHRQAMSSHLKKLTHYSYGPKY